MMFHRARLPVVVLCLAAHVSVSHGQSEDLHIFGYFQSTFTHESKLRTQFEREPSTTSFSTQQQNVFFQRDVDRWRAFVNIEFVNSFSSARQWGSASLEEVWVRYRFGRRLALKLGQSIPVFNQLNEIKTKTPLLPYIIRPLVYEASFQDFIAVEEYLPQRAYVQAYGYLPKGEVKFDYAAYVGNGPNLNDDRSLGQTGVDTTDSFLVGGRLGLRWRDLTVGLSATRDHLHGLIPPDYEAAGLSTSDRITRRRLGADVSWLVGNWRIDAEGIWLTYDDDTPLFSEDKQFYYVTVGRYVTDPLFVFASYWVVEEDFTQPIEAIAVGTLLGETSMVVPNVGLAYQLRDRIVLKVHVATVEVEGAVPSLGLKQDGDFLHSSVALSLVF